ncbi:hypothetical protein [Nocardia amamiensis]|uniref:hypothetical protein n=1 Tax=Nocardia amamiensis TaxID=404578 RepID=UPI000AAFD32B|nr:hypothetical protein [Nocardia amamiensis]
MNRILVRESPSALAVAGTPAKVMEASARIVPADTAADELLRVLNEPGTVLVGLC